MTHAWDTLQAIITSLLGQTRRNSKQWGFLTPHLFMKIEMVTLGVNTLIYFVFKRQLHPFQCFGSNLSAIFHIMRSSTSWNIWCFRKHRKKNVSQLCVYRRREGQRYFHEKKERDVEMVSRRWRYVREKQDAFLKAVRLVSSPLESRNDPCRLIPRSHSNNRVDDYRT